MELINDCEGDVAIDNQVDTVDSDASYSERVRKFSILSKLLIDEHQHLKEETSDQGRTESPDSAYRMSVQALGYLVKTEGSYLRELADKWQLEPYAELMIRHALQDDLVGGNWNLPSMAPYEFQEKIGRLNKTIDAIKIEARTGEFKAKVLRAVALVDERTKASDLWLDKHFELSPQISVIRVDLSYDRGGSFERIHADRQSFADALCKRYAYGQELLGYRLTLINRPVSGWHIHGYVLMPHWCIPCDMAAMVTISELWGDDDTDSGDTYEPGGAEGGQRIGDLVISLIQRTDHGASARLRDSFRNICRIDAFLPIGHQPFDRILASEGPWHPQHDADDVAWEHQLSSIGLH